MRRLRLSIALAAIVGLALAGCSSPGDEGSSSHDSVVTVALDTDIVSTDAGYGLGLVDRAVLQNVYDSLANLNPATGAIEPSIAKSWQTSADQLTWTFLLRDDVTFSDGTKLTAADVKATVDRLRSPDFTEESVWDGIDEAKVIDDTTITFHLSEPNSFLMARSERLPIMPKSVIDKAGLKEFTDTPIGSGAYKLASWKRDNEIVMEANDNYWGGKPSIQKVIFKVIPDLSARVAALQSGEVDLVYGLTPEQSTQLDSDDSVQVISHGGLDRTRVQIDSRKAPFDKVQVRQALNYAVDIDTIIKTLLAGKAKRTPAALVPEEVGFNPDLKPYPYDVAKAKALLNEAGFPNGLPEPVEFSIDLGATPKAEEVAQAIASYFDKVGVKTNIRTYDAGDFATRKTEKVTNPGELGPLMLDAHSGGGVFHGYHHYTGVIHCPGSGSASATHSGYYCNPAIDKLTDEMVAVNGGDAKKATTLIQQAEAELQKDASSVFLYQPQQVYGVRKGLNWTPDASGRMWMITAKWSDAA